MALKAESINTVLSMALQDIDDEWNDTPLNCEKGRRLAQAGDLIQLAMELLAVALEPPKRARKQTKAKSKGGKRVKA